MYLVELKEYIKEYAIIPVRQLTLNFPLPGIKLQLVTRSKFSLETGLTPQAAEFTVMHYANPCAEMIGFFHGMGGQDLRVHKNTQGMMSREYPRVSKSIQDVRQQKCT